MLRGDENNDEKCGFLRFNHVSISFAKFPSIKRDGKTAFIFMTSEEHVNSKICE